jgi:hypothetical protein
MDEHSFKLFRQFGSTRFQMRHAVLLEARVIIAKAEPVDDRGDRRRHGELRY